MKTTKSIKLIVAAIIACLSLIAPPVFADSSVCGNSSVPESVQAASGCPGSTPDISAVIQGILNGIIAVLGVVAVVYIVIGGIGYMTSAGDAPKVKKAKDTILYATIGLIICALAAAIVNFTIGLINGNSAQTADENDEVVLILDSPSRIAHL